MSTFLGWTIFPMPTSPAPRAVDWSAPNIVAVVESPFTGQQQIQNWQGGRIEALVTLPAMKQTKAQPWMAWLMAVQGTSGVFAFGDPLSTAPLGTGAGSLTVAGGSQTGTVMNITGGSGFGCLLPGDWIQIGLRLYRLTAQYNGGSAAISIYPPIRESPLDGTAISVTNTQGMFRMKTNTQKWSANEVGVYGINFEIREAL